MTPLFARIFDSLDERIGLAGAGRKTLTKIFPNHWSFLLGEIAMISFGILVVTGVFLTAFYRPSVEPVLYTGASPLYDGRELPGAFASIIALTHDIPGGQLVRRVHRATATVFIGVAIIHMLRIVLTGAFRRPREINYHIGWIMLVLAVISGWSGHNLIWDTLAGTSLRVYYSFVLATPYVGEWLAQLVFAGEFPTAGFLPRMYSLHVLLLPGAIGALFALHMVLVVRQTHTAFRHPAVDVETTVPGEPMWPSQFAKTTTLALVVAGVIALSAALIPWSEVDLHGPYVVAQASNASQPDWFLFWVEGAIRIYPAIDIEIPGSFISGPFVAGILLPLLFIIIMAGYPWLERRVVGGDGVHHHTAQGGLEVPFRAGFVAAFLSFYLLLSLAATNDVIARVFDVPVEGVVWFFRSAVLVGPPLIGLAVASWARYRNQTLVDVS
jgi:ubiquinol-cytochrome c reductase cytochrome b subunit